MSVNSGSVVSVYGELVASKKERDLSGYLYDRKQYLIYKRAFDLILSSFFIITVLSWLTPILALLIRLNSRGPVFFLQKRVGKAGRIFTCYKFRTMILNREADSLQASDNDIRITRVGRILRKLNVDEFPQFLNVLRGDMSIIGPRPHMQVDCDKFSNLIPEYEFRNLLRPGITGMAQIKGFAGPATSNESIFGRYQWDAFYIRNASFWLDLRILQKTFLQEFYLMTMPERY
ncbi:MAG TPA: sugar transferase [Puia sp.]|nr:sugar transferase [Puia sp.]